MFEAHSIVPFPFRGDREVHDISFSCPGHPGLSSGLVPMFVNMLKAKLHSASVTQCDLHYEGSVSIDQDLLEASGILPHERVDIWNVTNGARLSTYAIKAPRGSNTIGVNGAAARHFAVGDKVIIAAFAQVEAEMARQHQPRVVILDEDNKPRRPNA